MKHLFFSYSRKDTAMMQRMVELLTSADYTVWVDTDQIRAGDHWRQEIVRAMKRLTDEMRTVRERQSKLDALISEIHTVELNALKKLNLE